MDFNKFQNIFSIPRMDRYYNATNKNEKKTIKLYQYNLQLSQEMSSVISCFEVALRNRINDHYTNLYGNTWLQDFVKKGGVFDTNKTELTKNEILSAISKLGNRYTHHRLIAELSFGIWKHLFAKHQYNITGKTLLQIFCKKPKSSAYANYNRNFIFKELDPINKIRNRIAHQEPICFNNHKTDTHNVREIYKRILMFLEWMDIDGEELFNELEINKVEEICDKIDRLK